MTSYRHGNYSHGDFFLVFLSGLQGSVVDIICMYYVTALGHVYFFHHSIQIQYR